MPHLLSTGLQVVGGVVAVVAAVYWFRSKYREAVAALDKEILTLKRENLLTLAMTAGGVVAPQLLRPHLAACVRLDGDAMADDIAVRVVDPKSGHVRYNAS